MGEAIHAGRRGAVFAVVAVVAALGCYEDVDTPFPPGLEPWERTNLAPLPAATATEMFPEALTFARTTFPSPGIENPIPSVHARAYIRTPIAAAWAAARDPQTGRDPTTVDAFSIVAWAIDPAYTYTYRTHSVVNDLITLEWNMDWRHGLVQGTAAAPEITATRWQKVSGSDALTVLEGSLVLRAVADRPSVTEVNYQYHLKAAFSGYDTIESYLRVIYGRLRDRAHGTPLSPNDCNGCPPPPAGY